MLKELYSTLYGELLVGSLGHFLYKRDLHEFYVLNSLYKVRFF